MESCYTIEEQARMLKVKVEWKRRYHLHIQSRTKDIMMTGRNFLEQGDARMHEQKHIRQTSQKEERKEKPSPSAVLNHS